jgi:hypothetical protein
MTVRRLLDKVCVLPDNANRSPQVLQRQIESDVFRWSSVLKGAPAVAN